MLKQLFAPVAPEPIMMNGASGAETDHLGATERRILITPSIATEWLTRNTDNQPLSPDRVKAYARDMAAGRWLPGHARVVIGRGGILCNGQHTLSAIVLSGVSVLCSVLWDEALSGPRDWRGDSGRQRSPAFQAGTNSKVWAVANYAATIISGTFSVTHGEVGVLLPVVREYHDRLTGAAYKGVSAVPVRLAVITRMKLNPSRADELAQLYYALVNGDHEGLTASTSRLRTNLIMGTLGTRGAYRMDTLIRALSAFDLTRVSPTGKIQIKNLTARATEARDLIIEAWGMAS